MVPGAEESPLPKLLKHPAEVWVGQSLLYLVHLPVVRDDEVGHGDNLAAAVHQHHARQILDSEQIKHAHVIDHRNLDRLLMGHVEILHFDELTKKVTDSFAWRGRRGGVR